MKVKLKMLNLDGKCIGEAIDKELKKLVGYAVDEVELMVLNRMTVKGIEVTYDNGYCGDANNRWTEVDDWQSLADHSLEHDSEEDRAHIAQKLLECAYSIHPSVKLKLSEKQRRDIWCDVYKTVFINEGNYEVFKALEKTLFQKQNAQDKK